MRRVCFVLAASGLGLMIALCGVQSAGGHPPDGDNHHHDHHGATLPKVAHAIGIEGCAPVIAVLEEKDGAKKAEPLPVSWKLRGDLGRLDLGNLKNKLIADNLKQLHGCFMRDEASGQIFTVFPGAGLAVLKPDLKEWELIGGDLALAGMNSHGGTVLTIGKETYIVFASTNTRELVAVNKEGRIKSRLGKPDGKVGFTDSHLQDYYGGKTPELYPQDKEKKPTGPDFNPTSTTFLSGSKQLAVTTGYSGGRSGDFVLFASVEENGTLKWTKGGFGRRGNGKGELTTGHGITAVPGKNPEEVDVASRGNNRVYRFSLDGKLVSDLPLTSGYLVCAVNNLEIEGRRLSFYPLLNAVDGAKKAGVAVYEGSTKVTVLVPGAEKGLEVMDHIHGCSIVPGPNGKGMFALVQSWNPGSPPAVFELEVAAAKK